MCRDEYDFFIAHASADRVFAEKIFDLLSVETRVFLDTRCLLPGDDWQTVIQAAQRRSRATIVLISDRTDKAFYEGEEIAAAIALCREEGSTHRVIPVYCSGVSPSEVPYGLRRKHALWITEHMPVEQVVARLLDLPRDRPGEHLRPGTERRRRHCHLDLPNEVEVAATLM